MGIDLSRSETVTKTVKFGFVIIGMYAVFSRLWACEDAYITFRYIDNFLNGHGLVYNIGDRVEGFTHPLWLFLVTLPAALGVSIRLSALLISLALTLSTLILLAFFDKNRKGGEIAVPFALVLFITHIGFRDFSVSGLEFPLACFLMVVFYLSYKRYDLLARPIWHGSLLALLYLTRPELALLTVSFYAVLLYQATQALFSNQKARLTAHIKNVALFTLPIIVIAGGYHLFRGIYYGELFPNTYYAKDGSGAYWSAGLIYLRHFWYYSPILLVVVLVTFGGALTNRKWRRWLLSDKPRVVMLLQAALLMIYVTRLGGDFMAYRFLLPVLVILAVLMNDLLDFICANPRAIRIVGVCSLALTALLTLVPISAPIRIGFIADERKNYDLYHPAYRALLEEPVEHKWYKLGLDLKALQEKTGYPISIGAGNIGYFGYAAGPKVKIVDLCGLTDKQAARNWQMIRKRGRPGHDIKLSLRMEVDRHVTFSGTPLTEWNKIMQTPFRAIITLDPAFLKFYPEKIAALKDFKKMIATGAVLDTESAKFLQTLEQTYSVNIDSL